MLSLELRILLVFLVAYFSAIFVIPRLAVIAKSIGLLDHPERRKVHAVPKPLVGGIGFVIAVTFSSMLFIPWQGFRGLFLGLAVLLFIGFLDDFRQLDTKSRFLAQIAAGMMMIYFSNVRLISFGDLIGIGPLVLPGYSILIWGVSIFCLVGVINAVNLIDGLDGLAGGMAFIAFITFALHASCAGAHVFMLLNLAFAGALLGFLRYNWSPAIVFMGDAGSLCLGFALGFMAIAMSQGANPVFPPIVALLVLAVPVVDTLTVMGKRIIRGCNPFQADRYHFHHILMRYGLDRTTAVKTILAICIALSALSLVSVYYSIPEWALFGIFAVYFFLYVVASFFIVSILKLTIKHRRQHSAKAGQNKPDFFVKYLLRSLDYMKILRKDKRYNVDLKVVGRFSNHRDTWEGRVHNLSRKGCMAEINEVNELQETAELQVELPLEDSLHSIIIHAEHIWSNELLNKHFHGFCFHLISKDDQEILSAFLMRCQRHTKQ